MAVIGEKKYIPLVTIPKAFIERCAYMLPNRLQCWRSADVQIEETVAGKEEGTTDVKRYQFCQRHSLIQQKIDAGQLDPSEQAVQQPTAEATQKQEVGTPVVDPNAVGSSEPLQKEELKLNPDGPGIPVGSSVQSNLDAVKEAVAAADAAKQQQK